jgi:nucleotide-binding universal stress UspA family protein
MKVDKKTIIVPWDFSEVTADALHHAVRIAKQMKNNIQLLHVLEKEEKNAETEAKLKKDADKYLEKKGIEYSSIVLHGNIFSKISEYASDNKVNMVIMGTHGIKGMQKLTGSWALKVISGSRVPFIVVQDEPNNTDEFTDIVFPVDFTSETKEKVNWAVYIGKYFNAKIRVFKSPISDSSLNKKVNVNMNFAIRFFEQHNIAYDITVGEKSTNFAKETLQYAEKINADLLIIMTKKNLNFSSIILGASEQYIIANNAKIPVMCINPHTSYADSGLYLFGTT